MPVGYYGRAPLQAGRESAIMEGLLLQPISPEASVRERRLPVRAVPRERAIHQLIESLSMRSAATA